MTGTTQVPVDFHNASDAYLVEAVPATPAAGTAAAAWRAEYEAQKVREEQASKRIRRLAVPLLVDIIDRRLPDITHLFVQGDADEGWWYLSGAAGGRTHDIDATILNEIGDLASRWRGVGGKSPSTPTRVTTHSSSRSCGSVSIRRNWTWPEGECLGAASRTCPTRSDVTRLGSGPTLQAKHHCQAVTVRSSAAHEPHTHV